jgi:hypothetical protein
MTRAAREVLADCRKAHELLESDTNESDFRIHLVAAVALVRAVGHVLHKVDGASNPEIKLVVERTFKSWKVDRASNEIFWSFIEEERNNILKQYTFNYLPESVGVLVVDSATDDLLYEDFLDDLLFKPLIDGPFSGEDIRDMLEQAIRWWEAQLTAIDNESAAARAT